MFSRRSPAVHLRGGGPPRDPPRVRGRTGAGTGAPAHTEEETDVPCTPVARVAALAALAALLAACGGVDETGPGSGLAAVEDLAP